MALLGGRVPGFVYGRPVQTVPIFTYHAVGLWFERHLEVLRQGGYRTAGAEELEAYAAGHAAPDGRTVALTFDDGDVSLVRTASPLLARYGFRGIAFVVAGLVPRISGNGLAGWDDLAASVANGSLEIGSHSLYHHQVPVSAEVVGFVEPATDIRFTADVPIPRLDGSEPAEAGAPIFRGRPRYTAALAFRPDPEGMARIRAFVQERGEGFFARPGWSRELARLVSRSGTWETRSEADAAVVADMRESLERIAAECPNPAQHHLCYPWYARSARADALAGKAGVTLLLGGIEVRDRRPHHTTPALLQRLPPDLLWRLPGPDRRPLGALMLGRGRALAKRLLTR